MPTFWRVVNKVIAEADVLLLLLDSRLVKDTRNKEVEDKIKKTGKPLIYVITKCDLVEKDEVEKYKRSLRPCVFISATEFHGTKLLRERILIEAPERMVKVGVLGYPNVGKSSLINAMKGKSSASTSSSSGHTKGVQNIRADNRIMFLDTPGVIPYREKNETKHAAIGSIDFNKVKEPDLVVMDLMEKFPGRIESYYSVKLNGDYEASIEIIGKNRNILKKGSKVDMYRTARMILKDWQTGKIRP